MTENGGAPRKSNLTLWLILAVCIAPIFAATIVQRYFPPESRMNYGDLVEPVPLTDRPLQTLDGKPFAMSSLRGKWLMIHADSGACLPACVEKLWKIRQLRLTQGNDMERIERIWLITDQAPIDPTLQKEFAGTLMLRASAEFVRQLPAKSTPNAHIWLADPLGNVMLRYPEDADPNRIKKDLNRLLKVSQIG